MMTIWAPPRMRPVPLVPPPWARRRPLLGQFSQDPAMDVVERLRHDGALVTVQISRPSASGGGTVQTVKAMVDTGASISTVNDQVAQAAGLQATSSAPVGGVGGTSERPIYAASMTLPEYQATVDPIEVAGVTLPMPGIDMLVGRDVLRALELDYKGTQGVFLLKTGERGSAPPAGGAGTATLVGLGGLAAAIGGLFLFKIL